jgi:prophage tail gpP-like protein
VLRFIITDVQGGQSEVKAVISAVLNSELDVPADDLTVTMPYDEKISKNADTITAYADGKVVFTGQIDEVTNLCSCEQAVTKISARSLAGKLLDNEAEAVTYCCPAADFIFNRHLKPFGITEFEAENFPYVGILKIDKGMSQWQVFENFCKIGYGNVPRITGEGKALFKGCKQGDKIIFGSKGIEYSSLKENKKRSSLISEVRVKIDEYGAYDSYVKNKNPECKNINRVRYVNAAADTSDLSTADNIISQSNSGSYSITLECIGCLVDILGCEAELDDSRLGRVDNLIVDKLKYSSGKNGEITVITLIKEKF